MCVFPVYIQCNIMENCNKYIHQNIYFHAGLEQHVNEQMIEGHLSLRYT